MIYFCKHGRHCHDPKSLRTAIKNQWSSLPWLMARVSTKSNYYSGPISKDSKLRVRNETRGISYMHQFEANVKMKHNQCVKQTRANNANCHSPDAPPASLLLKHHHLLDFLSIVSEDNFDGRKLWLRHL
jgi:hypothetical protein